MRMRIWPGLWTKAERSQLSVDAGVGGWQAQGARPHVGRRDNEGEEPRAWNSEVADLGASPEGLPPPLEQA